MESEPVWRALASPHRRRLLDLLRDGPQTTGALTKSMPGLTRFAVMQHLSVLAEAGLVLFRKEGRSRLNFLNPVPIREALGLWLSPRSSSAAETALHLKRYAETTYQEVQRMDTNGIRLAQVEMEMEINAPRERVYAALTTEYANWWPHRYKEDSQVVVDARVGGSMGERFANGGGAQYGTFAYLDPPHKVVTTGPSSLNNGFSSYCVDTLEETESGGTRLKRTMKLWGLVPEEMERMFRDGTRALMEQALKAYCERKMEEGK